MFWRSASKLLSSPQTC